MKNEFRRMTRLRNFARGSFLLALVLGTAGLLMYKQVAQLKSVQVDHGRILAQQWALQYAQDVGTPTFVLSAEKFRPLQQLGRIERLDVPVECCEKNASIKLVKPLFAKEGVTLFAFLDETIVGVEALPRQSLPPGTKTATTGIVFSSLQPIAQYGPITKIPPDTRVHILSNLGQVGPRRLLKNGMPDIQQALELVGLQSASPLTVKPNRVLQIGQLLAGFTNATNLEHARILHEREIFFLRVLTIVILSLLLFAFGFCVISFRCFLNHGLRATATKHGEGSWDVLTLCYFLFSKDLAALERFFLEPFRVVEAAQQEARSMEIAISYANQRLLTLQPYFDLGSDEFGKITHAVSNGMSLKDRDELYRSLRQVLKVRNAAVLTTAVSAGSVRVTTAPISRRLSRASSTSSRTPEEEFVVLLDRCDAVSHWHHSASALYQEALTTLDPKQRNVKLRHALHIQKQAAKISGSLVLTDASSDVTSNAHTVEQLADQVLPFARIAELVGDIERAKIVWSVLFHLLNPGGSRRNFGESYMPLPRLRARTIKQMRSDWAVNIHATFLDEVINWMVKEDILISIQKQHAVISINPHDNNRQDVGGNIIRLASAAGYKLEVGRK